MPPPAVFVASVQYAPPVLRASSPTSSIGTEYGADETSLSDSELGQAQFERKCEERLHLCEPRREELSDPKDILLRRRPQTVEEEKEIFDRVMQNLRQLVKQLEDDELFEEILLRGTQVGEEQQPSSDDIDSIMRGLMETSVGPLPRAQFHSAGTSWLSNMSQGLQTASGSADTSATTTARRSGRPRGKARRS
ncbi:uncharacterized protein LAESUDRAFT_669943 [Laetiporus sulphureus 93-53]|uniref:Uncharacterized protein n=1 Tax=Laetiporus sulphureus 93-53 TaxID=1314785 RepID=A0A165HJV2_9APHY|nr:uncharacterized protein LAESUDRAFT_669943 [Laetiporus sulphureus 93-53]KZT11823.1 hypothetical protein LAESUDRAFT_669943 [Laetiporus sulphureus 93-53]